MHYYSLILLPYRSHLWWLNLAENDIVRANVINRTRKSLHGRRSHHLAFRILGFPLPDQASQNLNRHIPSIDYHDTASPWSWSHLSHKRLGSATRYARRLASPRPKPCSAARMARRLGADWYHCPSYPISNNSNEYVNLESLHVGFFWIFKVSKVLTVIWVAWLTFLISSEAVRVHLFLELNRY